jgi:hypothetical protein
MKIGIFEMSRRLERWGGLLLLMTASACGPVGEAPEPERPSRQIQELKVPNGLSLNGLSLNGLSLNGLSLNGLSLNGLNTTEFHSWFATDPELNNMVMRYVVHCAAPHGKSRTYKSPTTGHTYVWRGVLGLASDWSHGAPATLAEQRIISACLAAHANKYGLHISISVQGRSATGEVIPTLPVEFLRYTEREACFFGNLFNDEGIYVGNDGRPLDDRESTARACALSTHRDMVSQECPPLFRVENDCASFCTLDVSRSFYVSCTYNGIDYPTLTTRMRSSDIYTCGDGICQYTEKCGTGETYDNCGRDCGPCS